jgi:hypothetical protein
MTIISTKSSKDLIIEGSMEYIDHVELQVKRAQNQRNLVLVFALTFGLLYIL